MALLEQPRNPMNKRLTRLESRDLNVSIHGAVSRSIISYGQERDYTSPSQISNNLVSVFEVLFPIRSNIANHSYIPHPNYSNIPVSQYLSSLGSLFISSLPNKHQAKTCS